MKRILVILMMLVSFGCLGQCTLTANCVVGNWSAPSTWTPSGCGSITTPTDGCIVIIPACAYVHVDINSPTYVNIEIDVYGTLFFDGGQKINMCPGIVNVFPGGQLDGANPGSKINYCGTTVWNGGGEPVAGPTTFGGGTTLPIELTDFHCESKLDNITICWITATETNNNHFDLERSIDGINWKKINTQSGVGTSIEYHNYSFVDYYPATNIYYYQLIQIDNNGNQTTSKITSCSFAQTTTSGVTITYYNMLDQKVDIDNAVRGFYVKEYSNGSFIKREMYYKIP